MGSDRADYIGGNPNLSDSRSLNDKLLQWFDTSRFVVNAPGTFGNAGRNLLRGDGLKNLDLGLSRTFRLTEQLSFQFRSEFFNLPNHANFFLPQESAASSSFGAVSRAAFQSQTGAQRQIQFAGKVIF